jgi:hypothetical protein
VTTSTRFLSLLTIANLGLLVFQVASVREAAAKEEALPVLRGRGIEIVDEHGRLRAQLKVEPADPTYRWPDGSRTGYPETVIFRLITADGKPRVKLTTSPDGSGLMLLGNSDATQSILHAEGTRSSLLLRDDAANQRILKP